MQGCAQADLNTLGDMVLKKLRANDEISLLGHKPFRIDRNFPHVLPHVTRCT